MKTLLPYLKILRPGNALMAGVAVVLGYWLSGGALSLLSVIQMVVAAVCAVGYGNGVNDIIDVESDRLSHPDRPLPKNDLSIYAATIFCFFLCSFSMVNGFLVSTIHGIGTVLPLGFLSLYAFYLKGTPLAGNIIVSLLVAYAIIFGSLTAPQAGRLIIPALLAFLLNFTREIVKDLQDEDGDIAAGVTTTAVLPKTILKKIILGFSVVYGLCLFLPFILKQFGLVYFFTSLVIVLPLHCYWSCLALGRNWTQALKRISFMLKIEMLAGLFALAADQAYFLIR